MTAARRRVLLRGGAVLALVVALDLVGGFGGSTPGGPASSSYGTAPSGVAAYAELLRRAGHPVRIARKSPADAPPAAGETVVVLDAAGVTRADAEELRRFVESGGRLVAGGDTTRWLGIVLDKPPGWDVRGSSHSRALVPVSEVVGVDDVVGDGIGSWGNLGETLPVLGGGGGPLVAVRTVDAGRIVLLADTSPLTNAYLAQETNAALGLALVGGAGRPVAFAESYHGAAGASGLDAVPDRWLAGLGLGVLAVLVLMVVRGRRFGPPEPDERELDPARTVYVDAIGALLVKAGDREGIDRALREHLVARTPPRDRERVENELAAMPTGRDAAHLVALGGMLADLERRLRGVDAGAS